MSVLRPFSRAMEVLGLTPADDAAAIKRAYRKRVLAHPPDTDPDGFRRVREAYELLTQPAGRVHDLLLDPRPSVDPPVLAAPPSAPAAPAEPLPIVILRLAAARVDGAALLGATGQGSPSAGGRAGR